MTSSSDFDRNSTVASGADKLKKEAADAGRTLSDKANKLKNEASSDIADRASDVAAAANEALAEMRRIFDNFATKTGAATSEAAGGVKEAGVEAGRQVGAALNSAEALGREGLETIADSVARRPLTSLAIAAGVGMVVGYCSRESARR